MEFRSAQVFAQDELWHETSFGSEWVQFELSFGPRRVSARGRFWIGKGSVRLRPTWVYARYGFQSATGFGPTRVSARDMFRFIFFVSISSVFRFRFGSISIFSVFVSFQSVRFRFFCFCLVGLFCYVSVRFDILFLFIGFLVSFRIGFDLFNFLVSFRFVLVLIFCFVLVLICFSGFVLDRFRCFQFFLFRFGSVSVWSVSFRFDFDFLFCFDWFRYFQLICFVSVLFRFFQFFCFALVGFFSVPVVLFRFGSVSIFFSFFVSFWSIRFCFRFLVSFWSGFFGLQPV
ncbi:hypothetical protein HanOQP8_Chr04g0156551 [Helianthus annuus]|nr:hypothetical protein HanLR1_Chr04g0149361 [Helianthus annuus]KAJ0762006.1 hypothetical protein HanOQP8_Chr04g0156551 [Helianthus annuus]